MSTSGADDIWRAYDAWNAAIEAEFFPDSGLGGRGTNIPAFGGGFLIRGARGRFVTGTAAAAFVGERTVYLDMEENALHRMAAAVGAEGDPAQALAAAVRPTLYLWPERDGVLLDLHLRRLRRWQLEGRAGTPPFLAVLAVFSLAAEGMRHDENFRSNNYYARLGELLGLAPATGRKAIEKLTRDFRKNSHSLWNALNTWLLDAGGARGMPTAHSFDWRSHVGLPISQALMREDERRELRDLFVRYHLRPGQQIAASDMQRLLEDWLPGSDLDVSLKRLFKQADVKARLSDIASIELQHWDGTPPAHLEEHGAPADALLLAASVRKLPRPQLQLGLVLRGTSGAQTGRFSLAPDASPGAVDALRPAGGALRLVDPPGVGWRSFEFDGEIGFPDLLITTVRLVDQRTSATLTRKPRRLVIMAYDEEFRLAVEVDRIQLARETAILAHDSLSDAVDEILQACARRGFRRWGADELRGLPLNWQLWTSVELIDVPNVPDTPEAQDLTTLIPLEWTQVGFGGGFALPGSTTWLSDAPPELRVASFVDRDVVANLVRVDAVEAESEVEELVTFDGAAVVDLGELGLGDGDYRVALSEARSKGKPLASSLLRLRSASTPRMVTEIQGHITSRLVADAPEGAVTAKVETLPSDELGASARPGVDWDDADISTDVSGVPSALHPLAGIDLSEESESDSPIVEAKSGRMMGCLVGGGHYYRLDDAGRDAMQQRRWAMRKMIPAQCVECGHQKLFPPHLRHAKGPAERPKAARAKAQQPRALRAVRAITEHVVDGGLDLLLEALTYARAGRWPLFERLAQQIADEPWFPAESARLLSALGHIDLVLDLSTGRPRAWGIRPATLVAAQGHAVLTGARSRELVDSLEAEAAARGGSVACSDVDEGPQVISVLGIDRAGLPDIARSVTDAAATLLDVDERGALGLASSLPTLSAVASALSRFDWPLVESERFDFSRNKWVVSTIDGPGAYMFKTRPRRFGALRSGSMDGSMIAADSRLVKWLAAPAASGLMAYEPASQTLLCRLGAQLPGLYERAAVLCSGRPPAKRDDGTVAYRDVPPSVAAALHRALVLEGDV